MCVDRIVDERQQFARDVLDIRKALPRPLGHTRPSEARDRTVERWKNEFEQLFPVTLLK